MNNVCRIFMEENNCQKENCKFIHNPKICKFYYFKGNCKKGDDCNFLHFIEENDNTKKQKSNRSLRKGPRQQKKEEKLKKLFANKNHNNTNQNNTNHNNTNQNTNHNNTNRNNTNQNTNQNNNQNNNRNTNNRNKRRKNTESFEPIHEPADMRVLIGNGKLNNLDQKDISIRDVVIVPDLFHDRPNLYEELLNEMKETAP